MNMLAAPLRLTAEEFEKLPDTKGLELIDGRVEGKNVGAESSSIQATIVYFLSVVVRPGRLGAVFESEAMYQCFPNRPNQVRKPDVSFILHARLPGGRVPKGITRFRPDIAVEVVSPNDTYNTIDLRLADYIAAGVPLIWVVSEVTRTVLVYQPDGTARRLTESDHLTADPIVPGFRVQVADLFPNPPEPAEDDTDPAPAA
jgi:Uma2 family endonuclease